MRPLRQRSTGGTNYAEFTSDSEGETKQFPINETTPQKRGRPPIHNIYAEEDIKQEPGSPPSASRTRVKARHSYVEFPTDTEEDDESRTFSKRRSGPKQIPCENHDTGIASVTKRGRMIANTSYAELSSDLDDVEDHPPSTSQIIRRPLFGAVEAQEIVSTRRVRRIVDLNCDPSSSGTESETEQPVTQRVLRRPSSRAAEKVDPSSESERDVKPKKDAVVVSPSKQIHKRKLRTISILPTSSSRLGRKSDSEEKSVAPRRKQIMKRGRPKSAASKRADHLKEEVESETESGWKARLRAHYSSDEISSEEEPEARVFRSRRSEPPPSKVKPTSSSRRPRLSITYTEEQSESDQEPQPKKQGRPPSRAALKLSPGNKHSCFKTVKEPIKDDTDLSSDSGGKNSEDEIHLPKRKGRPPKIPPISKPKVRTSGEPQKRNLDNDARMHTRSNISTPSKHANLEELKKTTSKTPPSVKSSIERKRRHCKDNEDDIMLSKFRKNPARGIIEAQVSKDDTKPKRNYKEDSSDEENMPGPSHPTLKRQARSNAEVAMKEISTTKEIKMAKQLDRVKKELKKKSNEVSAPDDGESDSSENDEEHLEKFDPKDLDLAEKVIKNVYIRLRDEHRDEGTNDFFNMVAQGGFQKTYKTANDEPCKPLLLQSLPMEGAIETVKVTTIPTQSVAYRFENRKGIVKTRTFPRRPESNAEIPAIFTPSAEALPRCKYFQYIDHNIKTEDTLRLSHVPYVSDTHDSMPFYKELKPLYNEGVHGARRGWKQHISDFQMYLLLKEIIPDWQAKGKSINCLYRVIYKLFPNKYTTRDLENAFTSLQLRFLPKNETPISIITQKAKEDIHHSIDSMFCIVCQQYNCLTHGELCEEEVRRMHRKPRAEHQYSIPCGDHCVSKAPEFKKILETGKSLKSPVKVKDITPYKGYQQLHFEKLVNVNRHSFCQLATMMNILAPKEKKTCQEIYHLSKKVPPPKRERSPDNINESKYSSKEQITSFRKFTWSEGGGSVDNSIQMIPCRHKGPCGPKAPGCLCFERGTLCTKYCACGPDCRRRFPGCRCQPGACRTKQCQCFYAKWECDPDVCKSCNCGPFNPDHVNEEDNGGEGAGCSHDKPIKRDRVPRCSNIRLQSGDVKSLRMGASVIAGMGCFIDETAEKGDLIAEYMGEVISSNEAERRGRIYDEFRCSFIFKLNEQQSVDATSMGNVIRFANHSDKNPNCYSEIIVANGEHRIGIFAKRNIEAGEELTFDYKYEKHAKEAYVPVELTRRRLSEDNE